MGNLVLQKFDQMCRNRPRRIIFWRIALCLIRVVTFDNGNDFFRIDGYMSCSDSILGRHDEAGFSSWRQVGHCNIVQALKARHGSIDLDDDLVGHLNKLWRSSKAGTRYL